MRLPLFALCACAARAASRDVWPAEAYAQAKALVAALTLDEKLQLVSGMNEPYNDCHFTRKECSYVGLIAGIPRLGLSPVYLEDGPQGVADGMKGVTQWPSIMTISQSWRPELMQAMGAAMGAEHVIKGSNVMLGPAVALVRVPFSGRNFEYISEDPFLNAAMTGPMVRGVQSNNISACVKHWIFNSQETDRSGMASHVAERVGRELYEAPYRAAVDAGVGSVMCSFNRINDTWSCAHDEGLNKWLKGDLGFDGFVVSDWGATHNTSQFANGGLDQEQEWVKNATFFGAVLGAYVANGSVPLARLDDMATRVVLPMYALGYAAPSPPGANPNATANSTAHAQLAHELALASPVLLKNDGGALPLSPGAAGLRVAVIGDEDLTGGGGSGQVQRPYTVSLRDALAAALPLANVSFYYGNGNISTSVALAAAADVAIVVVGVWGSEGMDRANLSLGCAPMAGDKSCQWWPDQDALVAAVAAANPNTTVVVRAPGAVLMPWLGAVRAVVNQLYGGQESNPALAALLAGAANPAGKLTVSFPASVNDTWLSYPASSGPINPASFPGVDLGGGYLEVTYAEGLNVGYRWYDSRNTSPLFPFGHGLSYSAFVYSGLAVSGPLSAAANVTVSFTLSLGAGSPAGREVVQLYVAGGLPGDPPKGLKGFLSVPLDPAAAPAAAVRLPLALRDLQTWDAAAHAFVPYPPGAYALWVGSSSRDIRLTGTLTVQ